MSDEQSEVKLLRKLTKRERKVKKKDPETGEIKVVKKEEPKPEENPLLKSMRAYIPPWVRTPTAKLGFDTLMFVGSCVVVLKCGKWLHDSLDSMVPSEKEIMA